MHVWAPILDYHPLIPEFHHVPWQPIECGSNPVHADRGYTECIYPDFHHISISQWSRCYTFCASTMQMRAPELPDELRHGAAPFKHRRSAHTLWLLVTSRSLTVHDTLQYISMMYMLVPFNRRERLSNTSFSVNTWHIVLSSLYNLHIRNIYIVHTGSGSIHVSNSHSLNTYRRIYI